MKRILLVITTVTLLLTLASSGEAWQVNIKNSCNKDVNIDVTGEHLFWRQIDCSVKVPQGTTGTCKLPGAICPFDIRGGFIYDQSGFYLNTVHCMTAPKDVCCCWDVNVEVVQFGKDGCELQLR